jgi:hypothetical protein
MHGCAASIRPQITDLRGTALRFLLVGAMLLTISVVALRPLDELLLPVIAREVAALDHNVLIDGLELGADESGENVRLRANLRAPLYLRSGTVYPLGWLPGTNGWYQVRLSAFGMLQAPLLFLIGLLGWRARSAREALLRAACGTPLLAILIAVDAPLDLLGNFRDRILRDARVPQWDPLFIWDRFLEGGGGAVLAVAFALIAIAAGLRFSRPYAT